MFFIFFTIFLYPEVLSAPFLSELDDLWNNYKTLYKKNYATSEEENIRRQIWENNVKIVKRHNLEEESMKYGYKVGINHYSDQAPEEFINFDGLITIPPFFRNFFQFPVEIPREVSKLPKFVDWRKEGLVTEVKNQGLCGACWAFSSTESLEGQNKKKTGTLIPLSAQNLIDCAENFGCSGGSIDSAFKFIKYNNGIDTEESYPYIGQEDLCHFKRENVGATLTDWADIPRFDENALMKAVADIGPIAAGIDASSYGFKDYRGGVYDNKDCNPYSLNHAVLVIGYGTTENGKEYWLIKNSWGTSWGEDGYAKMSRNKNNQCGIASLASYPIV